MGRFQSGQMDQTVNLTSSTSVVRIHLCPPQKRHTKRYVFFVHCRDDWWNAVLSVVRANEQKRYSSCFSHSLLRVKLCCQRQQFSTSAHQEKPKSNHFVAVGFLFFMRKYKIVFRAFLWGKETLFIMPWINTCLYQITLKTAFYAAKDSWQEKGMW